MPAAESDVCALCGLPAAAGREQAIAGAWHTFCCPGCAEVYALFARLGVTPAAGAAAPDTDRVSRAAETARGAGRRLTYQVGGMWCASCAWGIARYLRQLPGVRAAAVDYASGRAEIELAPDSGDGQERVAGAIRALGYQPLPPGAELPAGPGSGLALRAGLALFLGMGVMTVNWALYAPQLHISTLDSAGGRNLLNGAGAAIAAIAVAICGWPILRSGVRAMAHLAPNADSLFSLSALGAYGLSCAAWAQGGVGYFDVAAMLMAFLLLGRWLRHAAYLRAQRERNRWRPGRLAPAWRVGPAGGADVERTPAEALRNGDVVALRPGEMVPADARLNAGWVELEEASLTGESRPVRHTAGDSLLAGAQVLAANGGEAHATVLRPCAASMRGQIAARVEAALGARRAAGRTGLDRAAQYFVPAILGLVVLAFAANLWAGAGTGAAAWRAVTLLIFACPCTLGLAAPVLETRAVTQAGAQGILVQDLGGLAALSRCRTVMLDKTGTVTAGRMAVTDFVRAGADSAAVLAIAAGLETPAGAIAGAGNASEEPAGTDADATADACQAVFGHPIAAAIRALARARGVAPASVCAETVAGQGQRGRWQGKEWRLGRAAFAVAGNFPAAMAAAAAQWEAAGKTVVWLGAEGAARAVFGLMDAPRAGTRESIAVWRRAAVWLISGDEPAVVAATARQLGIRHWRGRATPDEKARWVAERPEQERPVAVVGDGYNDAGAMAEAMARGGGAIAWAPGADLPCRAAAVTILRGDFLACGRAFALSRELNQRKRRALIWACGYNAIGLPLAAVGLVGPFGAAAAMLLSSFTSLAYVLRPFRALRPPCGDAEPRRIACDAARLRKRNSTGVPTVSWP